MYVCDFSCIDMALARLVNEGRQKIRKWMVKKNVPQALLSAFDNDKYVTMSNKQNPLHMKDVPAN